MAHASPGHFSPASSYQALHLLPPPQDKKPPSLHLSCSSSLTARAELGCPPTPLAGQSSWTPSSARIIGKEWAQWQQCLQVQCMHPAGRRRLYPPRHQQLHSPASQGLLDCQSNSHFHPEGIRITCFFPLGVMLECHLSKVE